MTKRTYTNAELSEFYKALDKQYRVKKTLSNKEKVSYIDFDQYLIDKRICVRPEGYTSLSIYESRLNEYQEENDKWEQTKQYLNRKEYAKAKEAEAYADMNHAQQ